ncbi:MAG TPA: NADH-quinone oxidoreductase subunit A [candidate division Zixibacteria bacterium]|nr:NADH-quinone oxidoreductase subunit A [candidate division Zixibacteria bacterium]
MFDTIYPILFLMLCGVVMAVAFLLLSSYVGKRTRLGKKNDPYECGVEPVGTTRNPVPVKFYLVAILFILFDIEIIFLYPWAVISRRLGIFGFVEMLVFIIILLVGYFYVLGRGALKWE